MMIFKMSPITLGRMDPVEMDGARIQPVPLLRTLEVTTDALTHLFERDIVFSDTTSKDRRARLMRFMLMPA
jgi:hypothetical protein